MRVLTASVSERTLNDEVPSLTLGVRMGSTDAGRIGQGTRTKIMAFTMMIGSV